MKYGYITIASAVPSVKVADTDFNAKEIIKLINEAANSGVEIVCFPELSLTGYSCQDLFYSEQLIRKAEESLMDILHETRKLDIISIIGMPISTNGLLLDCAIVIQHGSVMGIVPKTYLPNYNDTNEKRWFASAQDFSICDIYLAGSPIKVSSEPKIFKLSNGVTFAIELCEDVWSPIPPSNNLALAGADIIFNLSANCEVVGKYKYIKSLLSQQSARMISGYVYSCCGFGESTQDVVYGGNTMIFENGELLSEGERFSLEPQLCISQIDVDKLRCERRKNTTYVNAQRNSNASYITMRQSEHYDFKLLRKINPLPFIPAKDDMSATCEEILNIQSCGLVKRLKHTNCSKVVLGISGGLDSTLALLVCIRAFDKLGLSRKGIIGVTMPGFGTSDRTFNNALGLMKSLGIDMMEISIVKSVEQHFADIGHDKEVHDTTYENSQARERTQILMDLSNKFSAMVIGTGDLSELALGWATYNGDQMSMYGVNAGVPKTLIRYLVRYYAELPTTDSTTSSILLDIVDTPISPELIPADEAGNIKQKTEDLVGPYELHDFFIYYTIRYGFSAHKILMLALAAFNGYDPRAKVYDEETIKYWLNVFYRRFFSQQFKRSCMPDGPKIGSVSLSPRGDWHMPSDASGTIWMNSFE